MLYKCSDLYLQASINYLVLVGEKESCNLIQYNGHKMLGAMNPVFVLQILKLYYIIVFDIYCKLTLVALVSLSVTQ